MQRHVIFLGLAAMAFIWPLSGCSTTSAVNLPPGEAQAVQPAAPSSGARDTHENLNSALWVQTAVERQITCQMIFEDARKALDEALQDPNWNAALEQNDSYQSLPPAIVLDIDETVLDNSLFYGRLVKDHRGYDFNLWKEWVERSEALPVPGAADFVFYAAGKGVQIFYVTNRDASLETATRLNLSRLNVNLPMKVDTVLMNGEQSGWTSDKSSRRSFIAQNYRILLLAGDDLGDFVPGAADTLENRQSLAAKYHNQWGRRWFLLPNPLYGSWELALYDYIPAMSDSDILARKFAAVKSFGTPAAQAVELKTPTVLPDMTVSFQEDKCLYDGPDKVYSGKLTVKLESTEVKHKSYGLFMGTIDPDKSLKDLLNWSSLEQPPWVQAVDMKTVTPGFPTSMSPTVTQGPLYLICFAFQPDAQIGVLGPIEVTK